MKSTAQWRLKDPGCPGFTLLEVLIVLAIISFLSLVVLPSYQQQVLKTKRTVASSALEALRTRQEQFFINNRQYATELHSLGFSASPAAINESGDEVAVTAPDRIYIISLEPDKDDPYDYRLQAVPQLAQAKDTRCASLSLTGKGLRASKPASVKECW
ncbi:prepilin-type N-terminal cleavage/methylation domain-containing protein [Parahaliea sp. F7430]|uniref:Prepilin-type N-terminal cleavage/methylation domain-containing protein n=1 Tax=Sediminihaliea albiluteola TaxID=2758564 RepID=A0A7W2TYX0_9GAMM|nr:type IV pilin protein [Sediminihaliea albiluteola]MBA6414314.1 prepilin-type N-terminal cleavage/methylation domain-containing protein [Sediminihaliea albiluteola]